MQPTTSITARIRTEDIARATAATAGEFKARPTGATSDDPTTTEMFFSFPSQSDPANALKHADSAVLSLETRLEAEGIWHDIHGVAASGHAEDAGPS